MGREIRWVPPNWEHPRTYDARYVDDCVGSYVPLLDGASYEKHANAWMSEFILWQKGEHPAQNEPGYNAPRHYFEYDMPPDPDRYTNVESDECTWYQVYETFSEGTPVTPPFATLEEIADYLVTVGEWTYGDKPNKKCTPEAAKKFIELGWAPSVMIADGVFYSGIDCANAI